MPARAGARRSVVTSERWDTGRVPQIRGPVAVAQGGYALWVAWIEAFRRGEDRDIAGLPAIDGGMGSYVEARLLERLSAAFSERVRHWQSVLGDHIVAAPPADEAAVTALLRDAAPGLEPLARVAGSPLLPRSMSLAMHDLLGQVRAGARDAVEESSRRVREPTAEPRVPRVARRPAGGPVPAQRTPGGERAGRLHPSPVTPGRSITPAVDPGAPHPVVPTARTHR
jgi:hypothetical protein